MSSPIVLIFHRPARADESPLVRVLAEVRERLVDHQSELFREAGANEVRRVTDWQEGVSFGHVLAGVVPRMGGVIVLGSGAVALMTKRDARRLVEVATSGERRALTNNRYSSDVSAVGDASVLERLPPLPTDNALPRWLEEHAGFDVAELPGRDRLGLDLDTPLDVALASLAPRAPSWLIEVCGQEGLTIPRLDDLRAVAADPYSELLVFGRTGSRTLRWLERRVRCRVRFLAEERGLRASTPLAIGPRRRRLLASHRPPTATLGRLLEDGGPESLAKVVAGMSDAAIIDSRVLLAHRLGADEGSWPSPADRFASDLHRHTLIGDPWLRTLTASAVSSPLPILLGGHSLVGPGVRLLLGSKAVPAALNPAGSEPNTAGGASGPAAAPEES